MQCWVSSTSTLLWQKLSMKVKEVSWVGRKGIIAFLPDRMCCPHLYILVYGHNWVRWSSNRNGGWHRDREMLCWWWWWCGCWVCSNWCGQRGKSGRWWQWDWISPFKFPGWWRWHVCCWHVDVMGQGVNRGMQWGRRWECSQVISVAIGRWGLSWCKRSTAQMSGRTVHQHGVWEQRTRCVRQVQPPLNKKQSTNLIFHVTDIYFTFFGLFDASVTSSTDCTLHR